MNDPDDSTQTIVLRIDAWYTTKYDSRTPGPPAAWSLHGRTRTVEGAKAIAVLFPKSAGVTGTGLSGDPNGNRGSFGAHGKLKADGVNGGRNEAGIRRYRTIVKTAAKLGIAIQWLGQCGNSYRSQAEFESAIGK